MRNDAVRGRAATAVGRVIWAMGLLGGAAALTAGPAAAQSAPAGASSTKADKARSSTTDTVSELIVTAEKREESAQKVAGSLIVYDTAELEARNVHRVEDLALLTPSMSVGGYDGPPGAARISLRGIGTGVPGIGVDPNVGIYLDGVYTPQLQTILTEFNDTERVEILMGPQGTLYGRNATGGVVNVISKKPGREFQADGDLEVSQYDHVRARASVSLPVNDQFSTRFSVVRTTGDSFTKDIQNNTRYPAVDALGVRGAFRWTPTSKITVDGALDYIDDSAGGDFVFKPVAITGSALLLSTAQALGQVPKTLPVLPSDPYEVRESFAPQGKLTGTGGHLEVNAELGGGYTFTGLVGWRLTRIGRRFDSDGTELNLIDSNYHLRSQSGSGEARIASPQGARFEWLAGAYYYREDASSDLNTLFPVTNAALLVVAPAATPARSRFQSAIVTEAEAMFVDANLWLMPDTLKLRFGARESWESKDHSSLSQGFSPAAPAPLALSTGKKSWQDFSPRVGLDYFINPQVMAYAFVARGFKSGGFNSYGNAPPFDPETLVDYEVGVKSTLLEGKLRLNAGAFHYDYTGLQFAVNIPGQPFAVNNIDAKVNGAELEVTAVPTKGLELSFNASSISSLTSSADPRYNSNDLPLTPHFKGTATIAYTHDVGSLGEISYRADYAYQTGVQMALDNPPLLREPGYGVLNASITLSGYGGRWSVGLFGRNLTDKVYSYYNFALAGIGQWEVVAPPRVVGVRLGLKY